MRCQQRSLLWFDIGNGDSQSLHDLMNTENLPRSHQPSIPCQRQGHGHIIRFQRDPKIQAIPISQEWNVMKLQRIFQ